MVRLWLRRGLALLSGSLVMLLTSRVIRLLRRLAGLLMARVVLVRRMLRRWLRARAIAKGLRLLLIAYAETTLFLVMTAITVLTGTAALGVVQATFLLAGGVSLTRMLFPAVVTGVMLVKVIVILSRGLLLEASVFLLRKFVLEILVLLIVVMLMRAGLVVRRLVVGCGSGVLAGRLSRLAALLR